MECQKNVEQTAYPVFYDVDPSDVRKQRGAFGKAFSRHGNEHVGKWKEALTEAGNLAGWEPKQMANGHEAKAINQIVKEISLKLRPAHWSKDENLIGMEPRMRMRPVEWFSGIGYDEEVRMIGIKGMGGIGKTTLARAIFEELFYRFDFEGVSFIDNVREISEKQGLLALQKQVLSGVLSVSSQEINDTVKSVHEGKSMMERRLPCKRVVLVLDDVDSEEQLDALVVASKWFKGGSRVIITTRNEKVLEGRVNIVHDASILSDDEAKKLFNRYAFKRDTPDQGYEKLSSKVVSYAAGLPLTIKVLGSLLRGAKVPVWKETLEQLKTIPRHETLKVLEISYNGLTEEQKAMFLDVACFMKGWMYNDAIRPLESCGHFPIAGLNVLEQRCLITISEGLLNMHDSLEEMGKDIVRRSHRHEPNKHSRLWYSKEIEELLSNHVDIEATFIRLELGELSQDIIMKGFANLNKLRAVLLSGRDDQSDWKFDQVAQYFPYALRYLRWLDYPANSLPVSFGLCNLVALEMPRSSITQLWEGEENKVLKNLRFLDLSYSKLVALDLGLTPKLKWLDLKACDDLVELRTPDGNPFPLSKGLGYLNLIGCSKFESFSFIKRLESLELLSSSKLHLTADSLVESPPTDNLPKLQLTCVYTEEEEQPFSIKNSDKSVSLNLHPCTKLESVSEFVCGLEHLLHLTFDGGIPEVPKDLDRLRCLENLSLLGTRIERLPDSLCMLKQLESLILESCFLLKELPENLGGLEHLEKLSLFSMVVKRLPDSICMLKKLKSLELKFCSLLEEVPENLGQLELLEKLNLISSRIKRLSDSICELKNLKSLELESCKLLVKLPEDVGHLESLEKLILTECKSLEDIPDSICEMKNLNCFHLQGCARVEKLPEEIGRLSCLRELKVQDSGITRLPDSLSLIKGLRIVGSKELLESCSFAGEIGTLEGETFCYIQPLKLTVAPTPIAEVSSSEMIPRSSERQRGRFRSNWSYVRSTFLLICIYVGLSLFMLSYYLSFS